MPMVDERSPDRAGGVRVGYGRHPGVVDEDVHAAERVRRTRDDGLHTGLVGEVGDHSFRPDPGVAQFCDPLEDAIRRRRDHDPIPGVAEKTGCREPDALRASRARDDGDALIWRGHDEPLLSLHYARVASIRRLEALWSPQAQPIGQGEFTNTETDRGSLLTLWLAHGLYSVGISQP